jgi:hypothetical protein
MMDYLIYDEFGIKEILCIVCGRAIKTRVEIQSNRDPKIIIREISKHSDYKEIPVVLKTNQLAFLMVCDDCKAIDIGENEAVEISNSLNFALNKQLEFEGKLPDMAKAIVKEKEFNVLRKADIPEVMAALRGV